MWWYLNSDEELRKKWTRCIRRKDYKVTNNSAVCINHFRASDIIKEDKFLCEDGSYVTVPRKKVKLCDGAFPTIFPNQPSYNTIESCVKIKVEKQDDEFGESEFATSNVEDESSSHSGSTANQMATVAVDSSQEQAPECSSTACSPTEDYSYNQIFIKEEADVEQEAEGSSVVCEPDLWPTNCSTSETTNVTEVDGVNTHSNSPVEKYTETSVADKKTKLYSCVDCNYKTPWFQTLKRHIKKHTGEKPFSCDICDYKCADSSYFKKHLRIHSGEKPFSCDFCDFKCVQSSNLKKHLRTHAGEKSFSCEFCDFKCVRSSTLEKHLRTHTGEKPYICEFCGFTCVNSSNLHKHLKTHTGEKPYSCDLCEYECAFSSRLKRHIRTHTGEKPFSCKYCDYKCAQSSNLKSHIRKHTGETTSS
ncbi:zinc finger protein 77 isoform X2 [Nilaparvata lugens]|uniref:zinc finger protein 77 isoform X2 n=1 Tax=Nilaparvata lugens TaxID=108931 RepID=UPI00193E7554|nr:zinc finger protein 77 isoform X2 [Nilaparvata lugens]